MARRAVRRSERTPGRHPATRQALAAVLATLAVAGGGAAPAGAWRVSEVSSVRAQSAREVAQTAQTASHPAQTAAPPAPAVSAARPVVRRVDVDGDGRADTVSLALTRSMPNTYRFTLTVRPARGRAATLPVTIGRYREDLTPAMVWHGAAPLDGVAGEDVVLDLGGAVGDFSWLHAYSWRSGRFVNLPAPGAGRRDIAWHVMGPPFAVRGYTVGGPLTGARTVIAHSLTGDDYGATRYRGTHTTYRWTGGAAGGWQRTGVRPSGELTVTQARRYAGWIGVNWR